MLILHMIPMPDTSNVFLAFSGEGILLIAIVAIAIFVWIAISRARDARIKAMGLLASELGLQFNSNDNTMHNERFKQFACFQTGTRQTAYNTMTGSLSMGGEATEVLIGDFRYTVRQQSGKHQSTKIIRFSYALLRIPYGQTPSVLIRREHFFDKLAAFFGFDDIDFESVEFSKKFKVGSSHKRFAWDLIDQGMMEYLLGTDSPPIELEDGWVCLTQKSKWSPDQFRAIIEFANGFMDRWPQHTRRGLLEGRYRGEDSE